MAGQPKWLLQSAGLSELHPHLLNQNMLFLFLMRLTARCNLTMYTVFGLGLG